MIRNKCLATSALIAGAVMCSTAALADVPVGTDVLREWNLVVLGDLTSSSEVEGRTFVGGNLSGNSSNYNIMPDEASPNGQPGLIVVGNVTGGHKNLNNGSGAIVGGNVESGFNLNGQQTVQVGGTLSNTNINSNVVTSGIGASDPGFVQNLKQDASLLESSMLNLSQDLKGLSGNSTMQISGNRGIFNATPDADGLAVFTIDAADLAAIGEIDFKRNGAETVVVNVTGSSAVLNDNFLGGTQELGENVIWNFPDATDLEFTTAFGGSVLAPKAKAKTANYIEGSAVFGSLTQNGEMHVGTYKGGYTPPSNPGTPPGGSSSSSGGTPVPEPGVLGLFGAALAGLFFMRRRRRQKA
ncbi:choice-of-anchor A family protein [Aurantiacibacter suaedae]|uniref:choice-of-anchor A family protein n=1 Tax=Aurantiacibacter suaedae TaxID=2545755 RepID=UPI0010F4C37B|nr:choice-of-anchor A family protein [Aurantiacibacter suaedae]